MLRNHFQKKGKVFLYTNAELNELLSDADNNDEDYDTINGNDWGDDWE